jgi:hypothetical protein
MEEVLFGLLDHIKLKSLVLQSQLTKTSSQVLRSLLHCNESLERIAILLLDRKQGGIPNNGISACRSS